MGVVDTMTQEQTHDMVKLSAQEMDIAHAMVLDLNEWLEGPEGGSLCPVSATPNTGGGGQTTLPDLQPEVSQTSQSA